MKGIAGNNASNFRVSVADLEQFAADPDLTFGVRIGFVLFSFVWSRILPQFFGRSGFYFDF
jgi:hypothetical protein